MDIKIPIVLIFLFLLNKNYGQFIDTKKKLENKLEASIDSIEKADIYLSLSNLYLNSDIKLSKEYVEKSLNLSEANNYQKGIASAKLQKATLFRYVLPHYAYELAMDAHQMFVSQGDSINMIESLNTIGNVVSSQKDYDKALSIYLEAFDLSVRLKDSTMMAPTLNNVAVCYGEKKDNKKAVESFKKALTLNYSNNQIFESNILGNIGAAYDELGMVDSVLLYYHQSKEIKELVNDKRGLGWLYNVFSEYYLNQQQLDSAEFYARKALQMALSVEMLNFEHYAYVNLRNIYTKKNLPDSIIYYYQVDKELNDSLTQLDKLRAIDLLTIKAELEKNIEFNELKNEQLKNRLIASVIILVLTVLLILFLLVILALRKKKALLEKEKNDLEKNQIILEKKNIENDLVIRNREITAHIMNLVSKNNLLEGLIKKMQKEQSSFKAENQKKIQHIINELKLNLNNDIWKEFELRFSDVQPQFYKHLLEEFPTLTPSELKLSAFLKLNMSTKEIAIITLQNVKSIEKARVRLRKKLEINNTEISLSAFLSDF